MNRTTAIAVGTLVLGAMAGQARAQYGYPYPQGMPGYPMPGYPMPGYGAPQVVPVPLTPSGVPLPPPYAPPGMAVYGPLETLQGSPIVTPAQPPQVSAGTQTAAGARGPVQGRTVSQNKDGEMLPAPMGAQPAAPMAAAPMETEHNAWTQPCFDGCGRKHKNRCTDVCYDDDEDHCMAVVLFTGFDSFRGIADNNLQTAGPTTFNTPGAANFGFHNGFNLGIGLLESWGIGWQAGASWGHYDWDGRTPPTAFPPVDVHPSEWQSQLFATTGVFKRSDLGPAFSFALVLDYMINDNYGFYAGEPSLRQWRALLGFPVGDNNEIGFWGAMRDGSSSQEFTRAIVGFSQTDSITWTAVTQYNWYWRHFYESGAETTLYAGIIDDDRHGIGPGSLGSWVIGGSLLVPLTDHLAVYANLAYMRPSTGAVTTGFTFSSGPAEDAYNISVGLACFPCTCIRSCKRGWLPGLPVANNGTFLVDATGLPGSTF